MKYGYDLSWLYNQLDAVGLMIDRLHIGRIPFPVHVLDCG